MKYIHERLYMLKQSFPSVPLEALKAAVIEGIEAYAWMRDGVSYVGTCGTKRKDAIAEVMEWEL